MFVDTHAHLFFKDFNNDLDDVVRRALDAGVDSIVCPGTDLETSRQAIALSEKYDCVYAAVGFHPHDARNAVRDGRVDIGALDEIEKLSEHEKVVAIGEIGLDYHYDYSPRDVQQLVFGAHMDMAVRRNLPVIIHTRESEPDVLRIVETKLRDAPAWRSPHGVFHCFSGDVQMAATVIGWNFLISIPGPVTFPVKPARPNLMVDVVRMISAGHILLETDSPYLAPHPFRGKRNEPAHIPVIARKIAEIKGVPVQDVATLSSKSAMRLFAIEQR